MVLPAADLQIRNFLTGIDFCIGTPCAAAGHAGPSGRGHLPAARPDRARPASGDPDAAAVLRPPHAVQPAGASGPLRRRLGAPGQAPNRGQMGLVIMGWATQIEPVDGMKRLVTDHLGLVLQWLGLWVPAGPVLPLPARVRAARTGSSLCSATPRSPYRAVRADAAQRSPADAQRPAAEPRLGRCSVGSSTVARSCSSNAGRDASGGCWPGDGHRRRSGAAPAGRRVVAPTVAAELGTKRIWRAARRQRRPACSNCTSTNPPRRVVDGGRRGGGRPGRGGRCRRHPDRHQRRRRGFQ